MRSPAPPAQHARTHDAAPATARSRGARQPPPSLGAGILPRARARMVCRAMHGEPEPRDPTSAASLVCALALALALFSVFTTEDSARVRCVKTVIGLRMTVSDRVWRLEYAGTTYVPCGPAAPRAGKDLLKSAIYWINT